MADEIGGGFIAFILRKLSGRIGNKVPQKHHNLIKTFLLSK